MRPSRESGRAGGGALGGPGAAGGSGVGAVSGAKAGGEAPKLSHSARMPATVGAGGGGGAGSWEAPDLESMEAPKGEALRKVELGLTPFADGNVNAEFAQGELGQAGGDGTPGAPTAPEAGGGATPGQGGGGSDSEGAEELGALPEMKGPEFVDKTDREVWCEFQSRATRVSKLRQMVRAGWGPNCRFWKPYMTNCPGDPDILTEDKVCGKFKHAEPGKGCCNTSAHCVTDDGYMPGMHGMWKRRVPCYIRKYQREHEDEETGVGSIGSPSIRVINYSCGGGPEGTIWTYRVDGYTFHTDKMGYKADSRGNFVHIIGPKGKHSYKQIFDPDCGQLVL